jgi:hypothetical protein
MRNIQYIILRSKQIKKNTIIYEVRDIKTDEVKWVYHKGSENDIDDKYIWKDEYIQIQRDNKINEILNGHK